MRRPVVTLMSFIATLLSLVKRRSRLQIVCFVIVAILIILLLVNLAVLYSWRTTNPGSALITKMALRPPRNIYGKKIPPTPKPIPTKPPASPTPTPQPVNPHAWAVRSIDTMHLSRDFVCWQQKPSFMASIAAAARSANANFSTVDMPYDPPANYHQCSNPKDPIAYEAEWIRALRAQGLHVWFRQTWFNWEGSYGAPKLTAATSPAIQLGTAAAVLDGSDTTSYLARTYHFILDHPALYANGDIFTPEPEPQNGGVQLSYGHCAGPCQFQDWQRFNQWLRDSMTVDAAAFRRLGLNVTVGYWGLPCSDDTYHSHGHMIEAPTIAQMGVYTTDCYFHDTNELAAHLNLIHSTYNTDVVVGEWGDVWDHGNPALTTQVDKSVTASLFNLPYLRGLNYWQIYGGGGGEDLVDTSTLQLNAAGEIIKAEYAKHSP